MAEIDSFEKRRARNLVWSTAGTQDFEPPLLVYDGNGKADIYWNSVIGAIYHHFDWPALEEFYRSFAEDRWRKVKENLFWLALEQAAYAIEVNDRPAYALLRKEYVQKALADLNLEKAAINHDDTLSYRLLLGHIERINAQWNATPNQLWNKPAQHLGEREIGLLEAVESTANLNTEEIIQILQAAFERYLSQKSMSSFSLTDLGFLEPILEAMDKAAHKISKKLVKRPLDVFRPMSFGVAEHSFERANGYEDGGLLHQSRSEQENLWKYISNYFGKPLYQGQDLRELERSLCTGADAYCKLYYTSGNYNEKMETGPFVATNNRSADKAEPRNQAAYDTRLVQYNHIINNMVSRFRNSLLVHLEQQEVRSRSGRLKVKRIWRGLKLNEKHLFTRVLPGDPGNITVDLLLDASSSQASRQSTIAAQAYVLAESLTRCGIPVRISSFCSMNGYTIMTIYRNYDEPENNARVFRYFTAGGNRDGLGIKMLTELMRGNPAEHRLLITLSDCEPYDMIGLADVSGHHIPYEGDDAINVTAATVRRAMAEGISVMCIFTGEERALPAARRIYDRHFVRIRNLNFMAETVSNLLQSVIRSYDAGNG